MEQIQRKTRRLELVLGPEDGGGKVDTLLRRRMFPHWFIQLLAVD